MVVCQMTRESLNRTVTSFKVYAVSADARWLEAVLKIQDATTEVQCISCTEGYQHCLKQLQSPQAQALVLVDAGGEANVPHIVRTLRELGWQYIVVVSAAPSWKEAREVLQAGAYDYIAKSSVPANIRRVVEKYRVEIESLTEKGDLDPDPGETLLYSF